METDDDVEFIAEHLAEASVYRTYGFSDKAWDECVLVLHRFPNNAEARALLESLDWKADARNDVCLRPKLAYTSVNAVRKPLLSKA